MATANRTNHLSTALVLLMIISALAPLFANHAGHDVQLEPESNSGKQLPEISMPSQTGARAPCSVVQNDGGTTGDAGNTSATAKMMGTDPTISSSPGCLDSADMDDWYNITLSNNQRLDVDMVGPASADFDLMLHDGTFYYAISENLDSNETISFTTNSTNGGVYYVRAYVYSGDGNYNLDYQTTDLSSAPDLTITNVSGPANATAGDTVSLSYNLSNVGAGDYTPGNDPVNLTGWLSVNNIISTFDLEMEGNSTIPSVSVGQSILGSLSVTVPIDQDSGAFFWGVMVDAENNLGELSDDNNSAASPAAANITALACTVIDDAGTGGDVGDDKGNAHFLGDQFSGVVTGCLSSDDSSDFYEIHVHRDQNISAVLTMDSDVDFDLILMNQSTVMAIDGSYNVTEGHHENVTNVGTASDLTEGDYVLQVDRWSGLGNYTLEIWVNGTAWVAPYDCGPDSDWGQPNYDAGPIRDTAYQVGDNPDTMGRGCLDPSDTADAYGFSLSGMMGTTVELESDNGTDMYIQLYSTENGIDELVDEMYMNNGVALVDTTSLTTNDLDGGYYIIVNANQTGDDWESGWYNLTFTPIAAPLPDLAITQVTCPSITETTGYNAFFGAEISSMGGPMESANFDWEMNLIHENGTTVLALLSGSYSNSLDGYPNDGDNGKIIAEGGQIMLDSSLITTGNYTCVLTVDGADVIAESNESNNVFTSELFEIINEDELYADDVDRDGVPNDLDGCPTTPGNSWQDRLGCMDNDGDGYSNGGDAFIYEITQWNDTDGDFFGDNNGPDDYNGDDCPNEPGIMAGTNGTGCPIWVPDVAENDADGDGVPDATDLCADTPPGVDRNLLGCPDSDGDGVYDNDDDCPSTPAETEVDPINGCALETDGDTDNNQSGSTDDSSNAMLYIMIAAGAVLLLVVVLGLTVVLRSRGGGGSDPTEQAWATAISPEQQAYEQQLTDMGYTAEQARAYASQYFQN